MPDIDEGLGVGEGFGAKESEDRAAVDADVAGVEEGGEEGIEVAFVVIGAWVSLFDERAFWGTIPVAAPGIICPGEAEGEIGFFGGEDFVEGAFEDASAGEPIVPVAEGFHAGGASEIGLGGARFGDAEVIEAEVGGESGLVVIGEEGFRFGDIGPFGEACAPPLAIFGDGVELGEVESDESWFTHGEGSGAELEIFLRPRRG